MTGACSPEEDTSCEGCAACSMAATPKCEKVSEEAVINSESKFCVEAHKSACSCHADEKFNAPAESHTFAEFHFNPESHDPMMECTHGVTIDEGYFAM